MTPEDPRHGTLAGYSAHRRAKVTPCLICKDAMSAYERKRQVRRYLSRGPLTIDGTGTRRRMQALAALGWTLRQLDEMLEQKSSYCSRLACDDGDVYRTTADAVRDLYDRLSMKPAAGWMSDRQRRMAAARGWLPPLAWDDETIDDPSATPALNTVHNANKNESPKEWVDEVAIERILGGDGNVPTSLAEKREVVRRWTGSHSELARLTGWKVERYIDREEGAA